MQMRTANKYKFITLKLNVDNQLVLCEFGSPSATHQGILIHLLCCYCTYCCADMLDALPNNECRYVIYSVEVSRVDRKLILIHWYVPNHQILYKLPFLKILYKLFVFFMICYIVIIFNIPKHY